jgi:hypothetical protein
VENSTFPISGRRGKIPEITTAAKPRIIRNKGPYKSNGVLMNKIRIALISMVIALAGCTSMQASVGVGRLDVAKSSFDGKKEVTLQPAFVKPANGSTFDGAAIKLGLGWREASPQNVLVMVEYSSIGSYGETYKNIKGLSFNIDSRIVEAVAVEAFTSFDYQKLSDTKCGQFGCQAGVSTETSTKQFVIPKSDLLAMQGAKDVKIKITTGRTYYVADLKAEYPGNLRLIDRMPAFLAEIGI